MRLAAIVTLSVVMFGSGCRLFNRAGCEACSEEAQGCCVERQAVTLHPDSTHWQPLFAADLGNADFPAGVWFFDERNSLTATKDEAIWTKGDYENFVLDLEYMCDPAANSGVLIYCDDIKNWIPNAVEVQILDDNNPHWANEQPFARNGGLYGHLPPKVNNVRPAGEWNRMTITAVGKALKVVVNGEVTVDTDLSQWTSASKNPDGTTIPRWLSRPWADLPTKGKIGLQGKHGNAAIFFRNVRIKSL